MTSEGTDQPAARGRARFLPGQFLPELPRRIMRLVRSRQLWVFVAGGLAGVLLASYVTGPLPRRSPPAVADVVLHVYAGQDTTQRARHKAIDAWNNHPAQRDNRVRAVYHDTGSTTDEQREKLDSSLHPDSATEVDLAVIDNPDIPHFAHLGRLRSLDVDTDGFLAVPLQAGSFRGSQWALPLNADAPMLAYNADLLGRALGLDREGLRDRYATPDLPLNEQVRRDGATAMAALSGTHPGLAAVYAGQFGDYEGLTVNVIEQLAADGADLREDLFLSSDSSRTAVRKMLERLLADGFLPDGSMKSPITGDGYQEAESEAALRDGRVLFARLWPSNVKALADLKRSNEDTAPTVDAIMLPQGVLGGQGVAVASKSRHPREALELAKFLTGDMIQYQLLLDGGFVPTRTVVYGHPSARADHPYLPALLQAIDTATPRPQLPYYADYSKQLRKEIQYAMTHGFRLHPDAPRNLESASKGVTS